MAEKSAIQWTEATWNPWYGCLKISPGCKNCYMYREMVRYGRDPRIVARSKTKFEDPLIWVRTGKAPKFCFTCSWSDFFIEAADAWRPDAWAIIRQTPEITYQILTKRIDLVRDRLPADWGNGYPNVWLGVSAENQEYADARVPILLQIPAAVRWVSAEPLLGPVDMTDLPVPDSVTGHSAIWETPYRFNALTSSDDEHMYNVHPKIGWVVVGGESGHEARPMETAWARTIAEQCKEHNVAFFMKQLGGKGDKRGELSDFPKDLQVREYPVQRAEAAA